MDAILKALGDCMVKSTVIVVAVIIVLRALRIQSPTVLHRVWTCVLMVMLLLPALSLWAPGFAVPILPPAAVQEIPDAGQGTLSGPVESGPAQMAGVLEQPAPGKPLQRTGLGLYEGVVLLYLAGLGILLARLFLGMLLAFRLVRKASPDGSLNHSPHCRAPLSIGLLRPRVLLPVNSKSWDATTLDAVLVHEQAHVRRRDPLVEWLAMLNRCIYWFHPLAWWLRRKLVVLAEQACDEAVLAKGHDPVRYAELLLELTRSVKNGGKLVTVWGSSINGSTLAVRVRRILTAGKSPALSRTRIAVLTALCAGAIVVPILFRPARIQASGNSRPATSALIPAQGQAVPTILPGTQGKPAGNIEAGAIPAGPAPSQKAKSMPEPGQPRAESLAFRQAVKVQEGNPKAADAQMKILSILTKQMQNPDANQEAVKRAEAEFRKFLVFFPNNGQAPVTLDEYYGNWLQEDVAYIISTEERSKFLSLTTAAERERFIEQFWDRRNTSPGAADNPGKQEHYRRLAYANAHFACGVPGWETDRGRIYILYGEPDGKEAHPSGDTLPSEYSEGGQAQSAPFERWRYAHLAGGEPAEFMFIDRRRDGSFPLASRAQSGKGVQAAVPKTEGIT